MGQAAHLHRRRVRAVQHGRAQPFDRAVLLVGLLQPPQAVQGGVTAGVHRGERGGLARVDRRKRGGQQRMDQRVVADQRGLAGGPPQQPHHLAPLGGIGDRADGRQVLLRRGREQLRHPGQPPRHGQLQGAPPPGLEPAQHRLADPVVPEPHRRMRPGLGHQQALLESGRQRLVHRTGRLAGGGLQHAELGTPAQARHRLQHGPGLLRQGGGTRRQQPGHLGPAQVRAHRRLVPPPPGGRRGQQAVAAQRVEQLYRLIRVAARVRLDHRGQARGRGPVHAQHLGDHRGQARARQAAQPQVPHRGLIEPAG